MKVEAEDEAEVNRYILESGVEVVLAVTEVEISRHDGNYSLTGIPVYTSSRNFTAEETTHDDALALKADGRLDARDKGKHTYAAQGQPAHVDIREIVASQHIRDVDEFHETDEALAGAFDVFREVERVNKDGEVVGNFWANPDHYELDGNEVWADEEPDVDVEGQHG